MIYRVLVQVQLLSHLKAGYVLHGYIIISMHMCPKTVLPKV